MDNIDLNLMAGYFICYLSAGKVRSIKIKSGAHLLTVIKDLSERRINYITLSPEGRFASLYELYSGGW